LEFPASSFIPRAPFTSLMKAPYFRCEIFVNPGLF